MEGEVAFDDGDAGSGGHGAGVLPLGRGEVAQDRVVAGGLLVVAEVGGGKGQGVVAAGDDGDVVATEDHRDDRDDSVPPPGPVVITFGQLVDSRPCCGEGVLDCVLQALVDRPKEAPQRVGVVAVAADLGVEHAWGDAVHRGLEILHDAADAVAVDVDDGDLGQEGVVAGVGVQVSGAAGIRVGLDGALKRPELLCSPRDTLLRLRPALITHRLDALNENLMELLGQHRRVSGEQCLFV